MYTYIYKDYRGLSIMKSNYPASYYHMFNVYTGSALSGYTLPPHRGLFIVGGNSTTNTAGITFENLDGTTAGLAVAAGTVVVLPLVIKRITAAASITNLRIYGLL
jgi:hypothetical protein